MESGRLSGSEKASYNSSTPWALWQPSPGCTFTCFSCTFTCFSCTLSPRRPIPTTGRANTFPATQPALRPISGASSRACQQHSHRSPLPLPAPISTAIKHMAHSTAAESTLQQLLALSLRNKATPGMKAAAGCGSQGASDPWGKPGDTGPVRRRAGGTRGCSPRRGVTGGRDRACPRHEVLPLPGSAAGPRAGGAGSGLEL